MLVILHAEENVRDQEQEDVQHAIITNHLLQLPAQPVQQPGNITITQQELAEIVILIVIGVQALDLMTAHIVSFLGLHFTSQEVVLLSVLPTSME